MGSHCRILTGKESDQFIYTIFKNSSSFISDTNVGSCGGLGLKNLD